MAKKKPQLVSNEELVVADCVNSLVWLSHDCGKSGRDTVDALIAVLTVTIIALARPEFQLPVFDHIVTEARQMLTESNTPVT
jgi:hypothetical protein